MATAKQVTEKDQLTNQHVLSSSDGNIKLDGAPRNEGSFNYSYMMLYVYIYIYIAREFHSRKCRE